MIFHFIDWITKMWSFKLDLTVTGFLEVTSGMAQLDEHSQKRLTSKDFNFHIPAH